MSLSRVNLLKQYLSNMSIDERKDFAKACKTSLGNLQQIVYVNKKCGAGLAINIDRASKGAIPCDLLCPDVDFNYIRNQALTV